jgi:serine/threonine-protein kinase
MNAIAESRNESESTLEVGQILDGKYRVDSLIGQGGMAAVWAGTNERTGKRVALKVLLPSLANTPGAEALFEREGLAASQVNHPNVVTVFDVIHHRGLTCIVMESLTGEPLGTYLARKGTLSVSEAFTLLLPAMHGVSAAHAQGIIHRDLKPQNIFVCMGPDGRAVTTKVLDFGISVLAESRRDPSAPVTAEILMGTPAYMAPEQIAGGAQVDERADVYGLGVLLYEALAGQPPFSGEPGPELYERVLNQEPPPLGQLRPDLSPGLVQIIVTAMAKDPEHRFPSVDTMASLLEAELFPATPLPGATTPSIEAWGSVVVNGAPAAHAIPVLAVIKQEPSQARAATEPGHVPLAAQSAKDGAVPEDWMHDSPLPDRPSSSDGTAPSEPAAADALTSVTNPVHHRGWQALAATAVAALVAGTAFVLWTLAGTERARPPESYRLAGGVRPLVSAFTPPRGAHPPLGALAAQPETPVLASTAPEAGTAPDQPQPAPRLQAAVDATKDSARPAPRERARRAPHGRPTPRVLDRRGPTLSSTSATPRSALGPAETRAGSLSAEDF